MKSEQGVVKVIAASNPNAKKMFWTGNGWSTLFVEAKSFDGAAAVSAEEFLEVIKKHPALQPHFFVSLTLSVEPICER